MNILVVVDAQNDFLTGVLGNQECENVIEKIREVIRNGSYDRIYFTQDTHTKNYLNTQEGKKLPVEHCIKDTEGWLINSAIWKEASGTDTEVICVEKGTFGSFDLGLQLKENDKKDNPITCIDFVGVCTGICVISNVLITKAALPEVPIRVIENACACVTVDTHKTAIEAMKTCQVDIV